MVANQIYKLKQTKRIFFSYKIAFVINKLDFKAHVSCISIKNCQSLQTVAFHALILKSRDKLL
ncbi:hypothetical protein BpHYR1_012131 [Brachionus plicatilis]|uniref:Uncharacterized protein n=1 Tax=Brachionus plicatilis TaxID=10195 RepID=A0A3M7Q7E4_BRAPC|nr:hypothetical protein BpHYR1_012131 [Brachionus plicatilis]